LLSSKKSTPVRARVLFDYKKSADDELTLNVNDIVTILDKHLEDEGWWKGEINGRIGVFPGRIAYLLYFYLPIFHQIIMWKKFQCQQHQQWYIDHLT
jgi:hypothetical protein